MYYLRILTEDERLKNKAQLQSQSDSAASMADEGEVEEEDEGSNDEQDGGARASARASASASASADTSDDILIYFCKNCGDENRTPTEDDMCVLYTQISHSNPTFTHVINKYTKYDPTLPRTIMQCPKQQEDQRHKDPYDVIYIRYDDINMRFVYLCTVCDTTFTTITK